MTLQSPIIQAAIARLPEAEVMLAAAGIVISLSVTIESPVIMLLATSTALARTPQAYRVLRRYVLCLTILLTILAALVAFIDPIYNWLVPGLMGIPAPIAGVAQPGMQIMTFWTAAIGWRRFYQGILIRFDKTRSIGYGTIVRLSAVAVTALSLSLLSELPGVTVGACAWMMGVSTEMLYILWIARPTVLAHLSSPKTAEDGGARLSGPPPLTYWQVVKYHAPLAATSLLTLLAQPLIGAGLARMAFPEENLAAWPLLFSVLLFFRSGGMALPEVVIALLNGGETIKPLRKFSLLVAAASSLAMALIVFTPLLTFYLVYMMGITARLSQFIIPGAILGLLIPLFQTIQNWYRGVLMSSNATNDVYWGMGINLVLTAVAIGAGVQWQASGVAAATIALSLGLLGETLYLWWRVRPIQTRLLLLPHPTAL